MFVVHIDGLLAIRGGEYRVSSKPNKNIEQSPHRLFILDDENCLAPSGNFFLYFCFYLLDFQRFRYGKIKIKGRSRSGLTIHSNISLVTFYDAKDYRKTQAGSLPYLFGRKEWLEDTASGFLIHTDPGVPDTKRYVLTCGRIRKSLPDRISLLKMCCNAKCPAVWHRVTCVHT